MIIKGLNIDNKRPFYNNKKTVASEVQNSFLSALSYFYASVISTNDFLKK